MEKNELFRILCCTFDTPLDGDKAWDCYINFVGLFLEGDDATINYLLTICELTRSQRLLLRSRIAELGFELTPSELNQYVFLILVALSEYMEVTG